VTADHTAQLAQALPPLIKLTQAWALGERVDPDQARALRRRALLLNHTHYLETIPVYRRFAQEEGLGALNEIEPLVRRLMLPDEVFKSYDPRWLDENDFTQLNAWLTGLHHRPVTVDVRGVTSLGEWIRRLDAGGVRLSYSSGTSGHFSFVPRDDFTWNTFITLAAIYAAPLLLAKQIGPAWQRALFKPAVRLLPAAALGRLGRRLRLAGYDAVFLDFAGGRTGNQILEQHLAPRFRRHTFLYPTELAPSSLRLLSRGAKTEAEAAELLTLQDLVVTRKEENYARVIQAMQTAAAGGQKLFIFGTPQQFKDLCESAAAQRAVLRLPAGSLALFGGGWKTFSGGQLAPEQLTGLIAERLGLPPDRILEGYAMTELNGLMVRCSGGRFHIPPLIEPVFFDEALEPLTAPSGQGIFGFLDPVANAYPGFIISGDLVRYVNSKCICGLSGPAITEIGRAQAREVKGCGGIMASLTA
jgi:hypothetical protein